MPFFQSIETLRPANTPLPADPYEDLAFADPYEDLAFAGRAALYLDRQGLDHRAVVQCLIEEFELDRETAEAVASLAA